MDLMMLDFFEALPRFYGWAYPLNVMVSASLLVGLALGLFPKPNSRVRKICPLLFACVVVLAELDWQLIHEESHMFFNICGWFAEAALLSFAIGCLIRLIWMKVRR